MDLLRREVQCRDRLFTSERELEEILNDRIREESTAELEVSVYDTQRNDKSQKHRRQMVCCSYRCLYYLTSISDINSWYAITFSFLLTLLDFLM